jgi:hypothetical protein
MTRQCIPEGSQSAGAGQEDGRVRHLRGCGKLYIQLAGAVNGESRETGQPERVVRFPPS